MEGYNKVTRYLKRIFRRSVLIELRHVDGNDKGDEFYPENRWYIYATFFSKNSLYPKLKSLINEHGDIDILDAGDVFPRGLFHGGITYAVHQTVDGHDSIVVGCDFLHYGDDKWEDTDNPRDFEDVLSRLESYIYDHTSIDEEVAS